MIAMNCAKSSALLRLWMMKLLKLQLKLVLSFLNGLLAKFVPLDTQDISTRMQSGESLMADQSAELQKWGKFPTALLVSVFPAVAQLDLFGQGSNSVQSVSNSFLHIQAVSVAEGAAGLYSQPFADFSLN
jgi:hypothetical protein